MLVGQIKNQFLLPLGEKFMFKKEYIFSKLFVDKKKVKEKTLKKIENY